MKLRIVFKPGMREVRYDWSRRIATIFLDDICDLPKALQVALSYEKGAVAYDIR